ncbi:MAG: hypothetical protein JNK60_15015 [Acidobacteria bacterium]|nr:hypothetical protein [Acidobacteriota bacterium]
MPEQAPRYGLLLVVLYAAIALFLIPIFPHGGSANEASRWATTASLVEHRGFEISWALELLGPNPDTAVVDGRTYSNKAPAPAVLGVPAYAAARVFTGPPSPSNVRVTWTAVRLLVSTLPLLLLALLFRRLGASDFALAALLFGTPLFVYGTLLFSHVLTAVALYGAYALLYRSEGPLSPARASAAGALGAVAVLSDFPAAIPLAVLGAGLFFEVSVPMSERMKRVAAFAAGGAPFVVLLLAFNASLFGSPFSPSYAHESFAEWAEVARKGVFGISWPSLSGLALLLVSPSRGLFFFAPVLLLALPALFLGGDLRRRVRLVAVVLTAVLLSGHGAPHGGWAMGPRYLLLIVPFLCEALAERKRNSFGGALLGISIVFCVLPALTFPFAPPEFEVPHRTFWGALLSEEGWAAPTLLAFAWPAATRFLVVPVALAALAAGLLAVSRQRLALVVGAGAACLFAFLPWGDSREDLLRRSSIAERFQRPTGRLEHLRATAGSLAERLRLEALETTVADLSSHAPDGRPYAAVPLTAEGPTAALRRAASRAEAGRAAEAVEVLRAARRAFPVLSCELTESLGVVLYQAGLKDEALRELNGARELTSARFNPGCRRVNLRVGMLEAEAGRAVEARAALERFLRETDGYSDAGIQQDRQLAAQLIR